MKTDSSSAAHQPTPGCSCHQPAVTQEVKPAAAPKPKRFGRAFFSLMLSFLIAFFPKCPLCWAAYMSLFSGIGLSQIPFQPWLLPVLFGMLALHLYLLYRQCRRTGFGPLWLSLCGVALLVTGRFFPAEPYIAYAGIACVVGGSAWSAFLRSNISFSAYKKQPNTPSL